MFGLVAETHIPHTIGLSWILGSEFWLPANAKNQQIMAWELGLLSLMWDTQMELLASGLSLVQPWMLQTGDLGREPAPENSFCFLFASQIYF